MRARQFPYTIAISPLASKSSMNDSTWPVVFTYSSKYERVSSRVRHDAPSSGITTALSAYKSSTLSFDQAVAQSAAIAFTWLKTSA